MTNIQLSQKLKVTLTVLRNQIYSLGLKRMEMEYWTDEQVQFLIENYREIGDTEIANIFTERWLKNKGWSKKHIEKKRRYLKLKRTKQEISEIKIRNIRNGMFADCAKNRWKTTGQFPEGTIRIWKVSAYPRKFIKVNGSFIWLSVFTWSQVHGDIPKGMNIVHIDGNTLNCDLENLKMISDSELSSMNSKNRTTPELKELQSLLKNLNYKIEHYGTKQNG